VLLAASRLVSLLSLPFCAGFNYGGNRPSRQALFS
jgi:hypothetical protein